MTTHQDKKQESAPKASHVDTSRPQGTVSNPLSLLNRPGTAARQNPFQLKHTGQNPLKPMTTRQNPLQLLAKHLTPRNNPLQLQAQSGDQQEVVQQKLNNTGLPDKLKEGVENLSGYSMDDVKVHYNSDKPAQLQALAYAQGTDIHIGPGQEKHLPHEAWHVVQQKQGRVQPTMQMKVGVRVNDDKGLEREADLMGLEVSRLEHRKLRAPTSNSKQLKNLAINTKHFAPIQRVILADVNLEKIKIEKDQKKFSGARDMIDKYEIFESAHTLGKLYNMDVRFIYSPDPSYLKNHKDEPLILVGHGGGGTFMSLSIQQLTEILNDWGVGPGMKVVLAGCSTAQASEFIDLIKGLTQKKPIVNNDLAFTSPESEFTVNDKDSHSLFTKRNGQLESIDYDYCNDHLNFIDNLIKNMTEKNFDEFYQFVMKAKNIFQIKGVEKTVPKYTVSKMKDVKANWNLAIADLRNKRRNKQMEAINAFQDKIAHIQNIEVLDEYLEFHSKNLENSKKGAKKVNADFIEQMRKQLNVTYIDYFLEAYKEGGSRRVPPQFQQMFEIMNYLRLGVTMDDTGTKVVSGEERTTNKIPVAIWKEIFSYVPTLRKIMNMK